MRTLIMRVVTIIFAAVVTLGIGSLAEPATRYVATTGSDGPACGLDAATACQSISQAIALAAPGDTILVGPGRYGDLNKNFVLGDVSGEETGSPGCGCMLSINKNVIVISTGGAAVTIIDAETVDVGTNVLLITDGGEFGRPGKGFWVTGTLRHGSYGIVSDSVNVMVRGNQVVSRSTNPNNGITTVNDAPILIEGNQVMNWGIGIDSRGAATVSRNQVMNNGDGIRATGGTVTGNVANGNYYGINVMGPTTVTGNAAHGNVSVGLFLGAPFSGVISKNNMFGNGVSPDDCGLGNYAVAGLKATNNYWGVPSGPGTAPANRVCNLGGGTTTTVPFAKKPFVVKLVKP